MANWGLPARGRALVRTPPVLARYLDDLARQADAAADAEPLADLLRRNDRTRALVDSRLDRLTPEQQPGSLGLVARQSQFDQANARAAQILADRNRDTAMTLGAGGALGAGAFGLRMALDNQQNQQDQAILSGWGEARAEREAAQLAQDNRVAEAARAEQARARTARAIDAYDDDVLRGAEEGVERAVSEIDLSDDSPVVLDSGVSDFDSLMQSAMDDTRANLLGENADESVMLVAMDTPEKAAAFAPGPATPVGMNRDLEDLPGPQMRSVRALMRAGIPESRALAIILKGSAMSPDEYRMVTGGRR